MIKVYYMLTKPGILMGNVITTACGFMLASGGLGNPLLFLAVMTGIVLVMASACVFNNYIDRKADEKMTRTKNRALVQGLISLKSALVFGSVLLALGTFVLTMWTNILTATIALIGFFMYVVVYSLWKYRSVYGTLLGSVAGAVPPVIGYTAVSNRFDLAAFLLFTILVLWQMPHFYAIAMYRRQDYAAACIPVLPVKKGNYVTKIHMLVYIVLFFGALSSLTFFGYTGYAYLIASLGSAVIWFFLGVKGFKAENDEIWARMMFRYSLVVVTLVSFMIVFDVKN